MTPIDLAEAAPTTGIVWAYRFQPDGAAELIPHGEVGDALAAREPAWVWVHLALADMRCRVWIGQYAPVSELGREVLGGANNLLRLDAVGDEILGIVPDLHQELARSGEDLVRLRFVMTERMLITARQKPVHSVEMARRAIKSGKRFATPMSLFDAVIDEFANSVGRIAEQMADELDHVEDHIMHDEPADERRRIGRVRLQAVRIHRQLAQLRVLFHKLESRVAHGDAHVAQSVRALAQKLDAIDNEVGSLQERARLLLDEVSAKMTAVTNQRLFTLSIMTACLLPPTLVTGFFGMNTKDLPFQETGGGTWLALVVAAAAAFACYWALRRIRAF